MHLPHTQDLLFGMASLDPATAAAAAAASAAHSSKQQQPQHMDDAAAATTTTQGSGKKTKSSLAAKIKGGLFLSLLILVAALSTTVLRKPLLSSANWLRAQQEAGYAVIGAAGFVFLMLSGSSHLFDLVCGFFCGPLPGASSMVWF
jgi:uncharacterized membrane protein